MLLFFFFFFNDTATTEIYTLSLHDALPILVDGAVSVEVKDARDPAHSVGDPLPRVLEDRRGEADERAPHAPDQGGALPGPPPDRKSPRPKSTHLVNSYAVFCLQKKKHTIL